MARIALVNLASMPMPGNEPIFPIGARCVQAALERAGHETLLVDFIENPEAFHDLSWAAQEWDVIGFSIRNIDPIDLACDGHVPYYAEFIGKIRKATAAYAPLLVAGGSGYSLFANPLIQRLGLDVGVIGPGEQSMLEIVNERDRYRNYGRNVHGQRYEGFLTEPISHPASLMHAYAQMPDAMIGVETRRKTCYQECVYCPYAHISGQNSGDLKPIGLLAQEIQAVYAAGIRKIFFTDAVFNSEMRFARQVVSLLAELNLTGLTWSAYFVAKPFDDEFAALLGKSSIEAVLLSPDSLDDQMMKRLGKHFDTRHVTRFIDRCRRNNLEMRISLVFGGPGETEQSVRASADYVNAHLRPEDLVLNVGYRVLPSTGLARQLDISEKQLLEPTFYPLDPSLFTWLIEHFDSQFMPGNRLLHLMLGNIASKKMIKVPHAPGNQSDQPTEFPYLAITRRTEIG